MRQFEAARTGGTGNLANVVGVAARPGASRRRVALGSTHRIVCQNANAIGAGTPGGGGTDSQTDPRLTARIARDPSRQTIPERSPPAGGTIGVPNRTASG